MKTFDEYNATARDGSAFSNSTSWEIWSFNVCYGADHPGRRCVNDDDADAGNGCPLILLGLIGRIPAEWTGPDQRYTCTEKTTPADARRQAEAHQRAAVEAAHHGPLFPLPLTEEVP